MPLQQFDERQVFVNRAVFRSTNTPGTYYFMFSEVSLDLRIDSIQVFNSDTIDHNLSITDEGGGDDDAFGAVGIPAGAGYGAVPPVDLLAIIQPAAFHYLLVPSASALQFTCKEGVGVGKFVMIYSQGGYV